MYEYDEWFTYADADGDGRVSGAEAVHFFMRAGLPKSDLAKLWDAADHEKAGYLDRPGFTLACTLIGALQQYGTITRDVFEKAITGRTRDFPKPKMQGLELPRHAREPEPALAPVEPERQPGGFDEGFFSQGNASGQFSSPPKDDFFAMSSGVDSFAVAPAVAPTSQPVERTAFAAPPVSSASEVADASFNFSQPPRSVPLYVQPTEAPAPPPSFAPPPMTAPEPEVQWPVIGPNDWQRYQQMFLANTNGNPDGRLTGPQTVPILLGLNAPKHVLKDVWEVSDADKDGCLSWSEFVVAVYLTEQARNGVAPPRALPAGQFPPFSMTADSPTPAPAPAPAPAPQVPQVPVVAPAQTAAIDMSGLMTPSDVRQQALAVSAPTTAAPPVEAYAYRGPEVNVNAMPEQDRDLTTKMRANAEKSDRELWEEELKERQNNLSAAAAKEVLANLGTFVRKCETNLTEASYRARAAEAQVNEYRQKCDVLRARVEELASELEEYAGRIGERRAEYEELSAQYAELEKRHEELTRSSGGGNDSTSSRDTAALRAKIEEKEAQIAAEESRARRAAANASAETAAKPRPEILMDFGLDPLMDAPTTAPVASASAPSTQSSPGTTAKNAFDEWGNWGVSAREETPAAATSRHQKVPSEIPAVAAALDTSDGGFFDAIDAPPPPSTIAKPTPIPRASSPPADADISYDDPFGAPPPTPPGVDVSFDDPFGAAPSPGPTPPRRLVSIDVDPFAA